MNFDCRKIFEAFTHSKVRPVPKFKVGDWVIHRRKDITDNEEIIGRVIDVTKLNRDLASGDYYYAYNIVDIDGNEIPLDWHGDELEEYLPGISNSEHKHNAVQILDI